MDFVYNFLTTADYASEDEKLIPVIRLMRKLLSCNSDQKKVVLQHLVKIFESHKVSVILMDIIIGGLWHDNTYQKIPDVVYDEIQSVLPSDKQLDLKDSVYTSQLVEEQDDEDQNASSIKKKQKLPWTLLRVPTDQQCQIFHFLHFKELINVQQVCRALCIEARNPSAIYRLDISPLSSRLGPLSQKEWLSHPKVLSIDGLLPIYDVYKSEELQPITGNDAWGKHVVELYVRNDQENSTYNDESPCVMHDLGEFYKLEKCKLYRSPVIPDGLTASYDTLKELTLEGLVLTEDAIVQIQKFQNLEKLTLMDLDANSDRLQHTEPISLRDLKLFAYRIEQCGFGEFQRFLIGSNPETVIKISTSTFYVHPHMRSLHWDDTASAAFPIPQMSAIKQLVIWNPNPEFMVDLGKWLRAQCSKFKLFDQIDVSCTLYYCHNTHSNRKDCIHHIVSPIITVFQRSNMSTLKLKCYPVDVADNDMESVVNAILNAPFGTFTEIDLYIAFGLDHLTVSPRERNMNEGRKKNIIKERIEDAGRWLEPWLVFDEKRIKQIGLHKLDIELYLDVDPDYDDMKDWHHYRSTMQIDWNEKAHSKADKSAHLFDTVIEMYIKEQIRHWDSIGRKCISSKSNEDERVYTITLSLRV